MVVADSKEELIVSGLSLAMTRSFSQGSKRDRDLPRVVFGWPGVGDPIDLVERHEAEFATTLAARAAGGGRSTPEMVSPFALSQVDFTAPSSQQLARIVSGQALEQTDLTG
jgi:hypothetical protein